MLASGKVVVTDGIQAGPDCSPVLAWLVLIIKASIHATSSSNLGDISQQCMYK